MGSCMQAEIITVSSFVWNPFLITGPGFAEALVAHLYGTSVAELHATTRGGERIAFARQLAMYLLHIVYKMDRGEVAGRFGRDRSTVSHACRRLEDMREDPALDRLVRRLEILLREAGRIGLRP